MIPNEEAEFIRTYAPRMKDADLTTFYNQKFNKTVTKYYIRKLRQKAGIRKSRGRGVNRIDTSTSYNTTMENNL